MPKARLAAMVSDPSNDARQRLELHRALLRLLEQLRADPEMPASAWRELHTIPQRFPEARAPHPPQTTPAAGALLSTN